MKKNENAENAVEQSQESAEPAIEVSRADMSEVQGLAEKLISALDEVPDGDMIAEIVENGIKFLRDKTNRGDIKLINKSFKELRYAIKIFAPYRDIRKVSIFGSARTQENHTDYRQAAAFAKAM